MTVQMQRSCRGLNAKKADMASFGEHFAQQVKLGTLLLMGRPAERWPDEDLHPAPPLQRGDTVATFSEFSAQDSQRLNEGLVILESWGLHLLEQSVTGRHWGYLAGTDQERPGSGRPRGSWPVPVVVGGHDRWRTHLLGARAGSWFL